MMKDYIVKISVDDKVKNPVVLLNRLFNQDLYSTEMDKIQWEELKEEETGKVIATNTVIDYGF